MGVHGGGGGSGGSHDCCHHRHRHCSHHHNLRYCLGGGWWRWGWQQWQWWLRWCRWQPMPYHHNGSSMIQLHPSQLKHQFSGRSQDAHLHNVRTAALHRRIQLPHELHPGPKWSKNIGSRHHQEYWRTEYKLQTVRHDSHTFSMGSWMNEIPMLITLSGIWFVSSMGNVYYFYTTGAPPSPVKYAVLSHPNISLDSSICRITFIELGAIHKLVHFLIHGFSCWSPFKRHLTNHNSCAKLE